MFMMGGRKRLSGVSVNLYSTRAVFPDPKYYISKSFQKIQSFVFAQGERDRFAQAEARTRHSLVLWKCIIDLVFFSPVAPSPASVLVSIRIQFLC